MARTEQFSFESTNPSIGEASYLPAVPLSLTLGRHTVNALGLIDTGSTVNVLPYEIGIELGAVWDELKTPITLTGNLADHEARGLILLAQIRSMNPTRLAFAWSRANNIPLLLGQVNFFLEFDVCIYRSQLKFEITSRR